jgi:hypothetical protein
MQSGRAERGGGEGWDKKRIEPKSNRRIRKTSLISGFEV